jgi:acyl-CoA thioesterase
MCLDRNLSGNQRVMMPGDKGFYLYSRTGLTYTSPRLFNQKNRGSPMTHAWGDPDTIKKYVNTSPFYKTISMKMLSTGPEGSVVRVKAGQRHKNLWGTVHGGVLAALADSTCGISVLPSLAVGETIVTTALQMQYIAPAHTGELTAYGTMIHRGRRLAHAEAKILDEKKRLIAKGSASFVIVRREK